MQYFRRTAIVGFQFENFAVRITIRKVDYIAEIRATKGVNAL